MGGTEAESVHDFHSKPEVCRVSPYLVPQRGILVQLLELDLRNNVINFL